MTRTLVTLASAFGLALALEAAAPQERLPRDNLMVYRGDDGKPREVKTLDDWAKRRAEIVRGAEAVMGKLPGKEKRGALEPKLEEAEVDCGKYVRRLVTYQSEPGSRVPASISIGSSSANRCLSSVSS